jgi:acetyl/propionyl-CoA carboxylase alpha subunit
MTVQILMPQPLCQRSCGKFAPHGSIADEIIVHDASYLVEGEPFGQTQYQVSISSGHAHVNGRQFSIHQTGERGIWLIEQDGRQIPAYVECTPTGTVIVTIRGYSYQVQCYPARLEEVLTIVQRAKQQDHQHVHLRAPMPGLVKAVNVKAGTAVRRGESIIILEAMKMENLLRAPASGVVRQLTVSAGSAVEKGELLCTIELDGIR